MKIAGVILDSEEFQGMVTTVAMPTVPIQDGETTVVPADDLFGFVTRDHLGLDPDALTARQRTEIEQFIRTYTL